LGSAVFIVALGKREEALSSYPVELHLAGRTAVVVGLGPVGRRKAAGLAAGGARVIGVDPAAELLDQPPLDGIELIVRPFQAEQLHGASLVIAAGPAEVNQRVVADARLIGAWVCSTTDPEAGDFTMPAVWRSDPLVLTVSTSGASPALAAALRDRAAQALGPAAVGLASLLAELRPLLLKRITDPIVRRRIFQDWADPRWLSHWSEHGAAAVRHELLRRIEDLPE
jgi:siroheme synthase-like protein